VRQVEADETKTKERTTVCLPVWLKQKVEQEAKEDRRTMSVCVELALTEHFNAKAAVPLTAANLQRLS
jgi:hypothetical protein